MVVRSIEQSAANAFTWDVPGVHPTELSDVTRSVNPRKAPGPDGVPPGVLQKVSDRHADEWYTLLDRLLSRGEFPAVWKTARVV